MRIFRLIALVSVVILASGPAYADNEKRDLPSKTESSLVSVRAKVTTIDKAARKVTLQLPEGEVKEITAGPEVKNFPQIEVGDDVDVDYRQIISIAVQPPGLGAGAGIAASEARAKLGEKPAAAIGAVAEMRSSVEGINYKNREITLKGPKGKVETFIVSDQVKKFNNIKKGDELVITTAEVIAVAVKKAG